MNVHPPNRAEGAYVKKLNLFDIYVFGQRMSPLDGLEEDAKVRQHIFHIYQANESLISMVDPHSPLLETGRRAAQKLLVALKSVNAHDLDKLFKTTEDDTFGWRATHIQSELRSLESVLTNDMPGIACYLVSPKALYRTEDLIAHADRAFPDEVLRDVPDKARKDFSEAGKCLAYELSTACGFHLWRAVETAVEAYYQKLTGNSFAADGVQKNWGAYIKALRDKKGEPGIIGFLDHIRNHHRNPQMHPEVTLELNEALALFDVAKSTIQQMILAIQKLPAPPPRATALLGPASTP